MMALDLSFKEVGVICEPLTAKLKGDTLNVTGTFGVFYDGTISISAIDNNGNLMKTLATGINVSPLEDLELNVNIDSVTGVSKAVTVSVSVFDKNEKLIGKLADAVIA